MKKYCLLLLLLSCSFSFTRAQPQDKEKKAFALLDSISQRSFQTNFTYRSQSPQGELGETFEGKITVQGHKYRLTLPGQEVINNGQTTWTCLMEANEVQITDHDPEQEATTPWTIFANYRQDYTLGQLDAQQVDGQVYDLVKLVPKDSEHDLLKVTLIIAHTTRHIKRLEILDSNQTLHIFFITDFVYDLTLDKAFFNFNPAEYQEVEIIDMR